MILPCMAQHSSTCIVQSVQQGQLHAIRKLYVIQYCHRITAYLLQQRYALQMAQAFYAVQFDRFRRVAFQLCSSLQLKSKAER